jgi:hypothetical protein
MKRGIKSEGEREKTYNPISLRQEIIPSNFNRIDSSPQWTRVKYLGEGYPIFELDLPGGFGFAYLIFTLFRE